MTFAWVIEGKDNTFIGNAPAQVGAYRGGACLGWVTGHEKALRLSRKEDAEFIYQMCFGTMGLRIADDALGVCEHGWGL